MVESSSKQPSKGYVELLGQALVDKDLRERVLSAPESLVDEYNLSSTELETLKRLDRAKFDEAVAMVGGETTAAIKIVVGGTFDTTPPTQ